MNSNDFKDVTIPGYTIEDKLGRGAMAQVYLALQVALDRKVALKIMAENLLIDPEFSERFLREAKIVAQLSHPHIVSVYDVGVFQGCHYLSMEYHPGGDLKQKIKRGVTYKDALRISRQMAMALRFAHREGYIHRDVKPENILFDRDDNAILTDFGIARSGNVASDITTVGTIMGTPKYMSPEQAQGIDVDGRSDLYSLGVMIFEMLAGRPPYDADNAIAICNMHISHPIPELPEALGDFQPLIDKTMAKNAADRVASADVVISMLDDLASFKPKPVEPVIGDNDNTLLRLPREMVQNVDFSTSESVVDAKTMQLQEAAYQQNKSADTSTSSTEETNRVSFSVNSPAGFESGQAIRQPSKATNGNSMKVALIATAAAVILAISTVSIISFMTTDQGTGPQANVMNAKLDQDKLEQVTIGSVTEVGVGAGELLESLQILAPQNQSLCSTATPYRDGSTVVSETQRLGQGNCFSIQVETKSDVDLIIYTQSEDGTIYRLVPNSCNAMGLKGKKFSAGTPVRLPLNSQQEMTAIGLDEKAGKEWIYAVAVQDVESGQQVLDSLSTVPDVCSGSGGTLKVSSVQDTLNALNQKLSNNMQWLSQSFQHTAN